jgi:hypothetical protein
MLVIGGVACLAFAVLAVRRLLPGPDRPESAWTDTEVKASAVALSLLMLLLAGVGLIVQGVFGR